MNTYILRSTNFYIGLLTALIIVSLVSLGAVSLQKVLAAEPTTQAQAAADVLEQQKIKDENRPAYEAWLKADAQQKKSQACVNDESLCPLATGAPSAE